METFEEWVFKRKKRDKKLEKPIAASATKTNSTSDTIAYIPKAAKKNMAKGDKLFMNRRTGDWYVRIQECLGKTSYFK